MKNCESCGIEVNVVITPFADEATGYIGENGVTCFKCDGVLVEATDTELAEEMGVTICEEPDYWDDE